MAEGYHRLATHWHARKDGAIVWIDGDEGTGKRIVKVGDRRFGTFKWNRATEEEARAACPDEESQALIDLAVCEPGNRCSYHDEWLTPAEAAAITGTAESTWRNKAAAGQIPAILKGKQWLLPRTGLEMLGLL